MNSTELLKNRLVYGTASIAIATMGFLGSSAVMAQESSAEVEDDFEEVEEVVVTGSRIRRNAFSSASPIQVISGETSRELGLFDTAKILQSSTQASGLQIDNTFTSFVLDNGPGAANLAFRGLDSERTLVLMNGRRIAPAGVGGAPTSPDLNLIPFIMIERVENLLDGASAVYGSDAVAGVSNIIMRTDVDGFEVQGSYNLPQQRGGAEKTISAMYGKTFDKGSFVIGGEFYQRDPVLYKDREITQACNEHYYEDENGNILTDYRGLAPGTSDSNCKLDTINRMFYPFVFGNLWYTPGTSNLTNDGTAPWTPAGWTFDGIPNWSDTAIGIGFEGYNNALVPIDINGDGIIDPDVDQSLIDPDGDGLTDVDLQTAFYNAAISDRYQSGHFLSPLERISIYGAGDYTINEDSNTTVYFEGMYSQRNSDVYSPGATLFPDVPQSNPFNPCNELDCLGFFGPFFGQAEVTPIVAIQGDRDYNDVKVYQYRVLGGINGDIPALENFAGGNWAYDAHVAYSRSKGTDRQYGVLGDRLELSINTTIEDPNNPGSYICGADGNGDGIPDGTDGCVPVNMFAPSIYQAGGGTFATQAETDYLFGERYFETVVEQTIASGYIAGDLFTLPWNDTTVPIVFGYEHRRDSIASIPNDVAAEGLLYAFFSDRGASGSRNLNEFFAETELQLLRGKKMAEELTVTASGRWTDESNFDPAWTYSLKGIYRPTNWLTLRGTYGTAFRAPNLREAFLNATTGFNSISDPCVVPADARRPIDITDPTAGSEYFATGDDRDQRVLDACSAAGVDPTTTGLNPDVNDTYSVEISTGGTDQLDPETSRSYTYGIVFEQPFTDKFDLRLGVTWYDILVKQSIEEPGQQFLVNRCYDNIEQPNATSEFCSRITRDSDNLVDQLDTSFINIGRITSKGTDFNLYYAQDFEVGEEMLSVSLDARASYLKEQIFQIVDEIDDNAGETDQPNWRAQATLSLDYGDFGLNWRTRWIQGGEETPSDFDDDAAPCDGLPVACRPVYYTSDYDIHSVSFTWSPGDVAWSFGVQNLFDTKPPRIDTGGVFGINNFPLGVGYDLQGRTFYTSFSVRF